MIETDDELLQRHKYVKELVTKAKKSAERCNTPGRRGEKWRWAGCLNFTLLEIESEMEERGLIQ